MLVVALVGLSLTACSDGDDLSTDQYGNEISLQSFGPCPVLRGGTLYLYGTNLDQIESVNLPGADPITAYEVLQSGRESKISIQVPAEKCEPGQIVIKTKKGGEITSITPITYREDIVLDKFFVGDNEENLVGNVGDIVTIKGDYLNLMHGVIFEKEDTIKEEQFIAHDRYTIKVAIPVEAKTGAIKLTDLAAEPTEIESKQDLVVNIPEATPIQDLSIKAGATLTLKGTDFDQIASVKLEGATVDAADFKSQSKTEITLAVPAKATDGTVYVVTKSGVEIPVGNIITVVPTELVATPNPVKNGAEVTITGKDLDLVTGVAFPNGNDTTVTLGSTIKAIVPITAQEKDADGNGIALSLANGKKVFVAYTLVQPTVTSCNPASITAGDRVRIMGTDLDLVESITFPGDVAQTVKEFAAQNANAIGVVVPSSCSGSGFKLNLKNGTTVEIEGQLSIKAATDPAIASITPGEAIAGEQITITGKNFQNVEALYIGTYKITRFDDRSNTKIICKVPADAVDGTYKITMETPEGNKIDGPDFKVIPAERDIAELVTNMDGKPITYPFDFSWSSGSGKFYLNKDVFEKVNVKVGSKLIVYKSLDITGQVQINKNDTGWPNITTISDWNKTESKLEYIFDETAVEVANSCGFAIQGDLTGVTKITLLP